LKYRLAIFDVDGTLADSFPWFAKVLNGVADEFGFRRVTADEVEALRGCDAQEILRRLEVPRFRLPMIARHMRALKTRHLDEIALFAGVGGMLRQLAEAGLVLAVVSSDSEANVRGTLGAQNQKLIAHYACGASLFGKRAKFSAVMRRTRVEPKRTIAIGDELRDAEAARQVGIAFGAVSWGYTGIAALRAAAPEEIFSSVEEIAAKLA